MWIPVAESHTVSVLVTLSHTFLKTVLFKSELTNIATATISLQGLIPESYQYQSVTYQDILSEYFIHLVYN